MLWDSLRLTLILVLIRMTLTLANSSLACSLESVRVGTRKNSEIHSSRREWSIERRPLMLIARDVPPMVLLMVKQLAST
jgi:hypothetical protein